MGSILPLLGVLLPRVPAVRDAAMDGVAGAAHAGRAAFGVMHYSEAGPEVVASLPQALVLGLVALRAKSFFPCFLIHWAAAVTFDVLVITAGSYGSHPRLSRRAPLVHAPCSGLHWRALAIYFPKREARSWRASA